MEKKGKNLLQMMKLHGHLSKEEINMWPPLHGTDKVGLWNIRSDNTIKQNSPSHGSVITASSTSNTVVHHTD